jgi:hypothetical protein
VVSCTNPNTSHAASTLIGTAGSPVKGSFVAGDQLQLMVQVQNSGGQPEGDFLDSRTGKTISVVGPTILSKLKITSP